MTLASTWANIIRIGKGRDHMQSTAGRSGKTLYERLGGYDVIAAIVDEFLRSLRADPMFARFGGGRSLDSTRRGRELLVSQMCELSGGPCAYFGRDMRAAHGGLGITAPEWEAALRHTAAALDHFKVSAKEKEEFIALFERYRNDIVEA
ncbi:MAG TPA: group 1 truncated hemoglobin [Terriglobia bacterium]|nr:group 1 truncated hemoglobin [Terriglobia bacterium]